MRTVLTNGWDRSTLLLIVAVLAVIGLVWLAWPDSGTISWVGDTDLDVELQFTDADTGQPVPKVKMEVFRIETNFCAAQDKVPFTLTAGADGIIKRYFKDCMCFGSDGGGLHTFAVHIPGWMYRLSAPGYATELFYVLDNQENVQRVQRGHGVATLVVPIALHKVPAKQAQQQQEH